MRKNKMLSFLLSLSLLVPAAIPGTLSLPAYAAEEPKGMEISKTATSNEDGTYQITLEAYATGEKISSEITRDVPTDIVLVLDQSGSMRNKDFPSVGETKFEAYTGDETKNSTLYSKRHNQNGGSNKNLYYKLEDNSYATVSVTRTQGESEDSYAVCPSGWNNGAVSGADNYWSNKNNLYVENGGVYQKVELKRSGSVLNYAYTYTFPDDSTFESKGTFNSPGNFGGKGPLYVLRPTREYTYVYTCTDAEGNTINIGTSTGNDVRFDGATLYEKITIQGGDITRLEALKNAVNGFQSAVAEKAKGKDGQLGTDDDVNHRIAVVGFAYGRQGHYNDPAYTNTELFIGSTQYRYDKLRDSNYKNAFQDMDTAQGQNNVNASVRALSANGATYVDYGMKIANGILHANPVPNGEKRNRVVIVFTDGAPGWNGYESDVANNAITEANKTRNTHKANVYSVGIFEGADATSAGNQSGNDTAKANWFMQNLSDNKGTPQTPSYYLSASDSATLNNIFQQISDQIQEGGSAIDLGSEAVIRDVISPQFHLPEGITKDDIKLYTAPCIGENQFGDPVIAKGVTASIDGDQVSVTGFDFKENWCGTETVNGTENYRGNKLMISFPVAVKEGFLGGNGVYTNERAGVYENASATDPIFTFEKPKMDVEIKQPTVTPGDKNIYLTGGLTADQIKSGATVKVGNVDINLDPNVENYGLEEWQNEYVNITVTYKDSQGNEVTDLKDLRDDTTYTVEVKLSPKFTGDVMEKTGSGNGSINVFKPELTYKDSTAYYGDTFSEDFSDNLEKIEWKHNDIQASTVIMIGNEPELKFAYKPETANIVVDGKIATKQDIEVSVDVRVDGMAANESLNDSIAFKHQDCNPKCGWTIPDPNNGNPAFLIHVKTGQLTVTKTGGAANEPYVFDVYKDGKKYSEVTIVGNSSETIYELPVGSYTIVEDENWSWRYDGTEGAAVELTADRHTGDITCSNRKNEPYWLNGFSEVVKNIFGVKN